MDTAEKVAVKTAEKTAEKTAAKFGTEETGFLITPGIYPDIDDVDYHSSPGISKHGLDLINRSPAHFQQFTIDESPALTFGRAFHAYVLEPEKFASKFVLAAFDDFRTKAAKEWRIEVQDSGATVLSKADYETIVIMGEKIKSHGSAGDLLNLNNGRAEHSAYWVDNDKNIWKREPPTYRLCRCRPDFINDEYNFVVDLKTTYCAGYSAFSRDAVKYRYHVQDAFYTDGLRQRKQRVDAFVFVCIEKKPPYGIGVYELSKDERELGRMIYQRDMITYHKAMSEKKWPCYPEEVRVVDLPRWARFVDIY